MTTIIAARPGGESSVCDTDATALSPGGHHHDFYHGYHDGDGGDDHHDFFVVFWKFHNAIDHTRGPVNNKDDNGNDSDGPDFNDGQSVNRTYLCELIFWSE